MPTRSYTIKNPVTGRVLAYCDDRWTNSPRSGGKLVLQAQACQMSVCNLTKDVKSSSGLYDLGYGPDAMVSVYGGPYGRDTSAWTDMDNIALAKFNGKLNKGAASLGVTLGSWAQSVGMITHRSKQIAAIFGLIEYRLLNRRPPRKRKGNRPTWRDTARTRAGDILEWNFGWVPLAQDIHDALEVMVSVPDPQWVRGSHTAVVEQYTVNPPPSWEPSYRDTIRWSGSARCTIAAKATIDNPNAYLANKLGLINPAAVAWDLVPWSFVVNQFVNMNQIISGLTDHIGLSFSNSSTTRSRALSCTTMVTCAGTYPSAKEPWLRGVQMTQRQLVSKYRTVGSLPTPSLRLRAPNLNLGQAVTASALIVQNAHKIELAWSKFLAKAR